MHVSIKIVVLLCAALSQTHGLNLFPPLTEEACTDPTHLNSPICDLIPPGCQTPVCARDTLGNTSWFKSICHLFSANIQCRTRYRPSSSDLCLPEMAPPSNGQPCPIPILFGLSRPPVPIK